MNNPSMADLARRQTARIEEQRAQNRINFPNAAWHMAMFEITAPRLVYAEEGGKTIGKVPEEIQ